MRFALFYISFTLLLFSYDLTAQRIIKVNGAVLNEENKPLVAATVVLLNLPDSSFASYGLTNDQGRFQLDGKRDSLYLLQISYLGYTPYLKKIYLSKDTLLETIQLQDATKTLEAIEITAEHIPVQMRGDTLAFNSAAFHVRTHDNVESLLKQLPGLEVDENGEITVNGKKVTEVLVDGKTFFGENAQIALKGLPADAIKKIEITSTKKDKDGLELTNDEKTIDLKLKKNAKRGVWGVIEAGYGSTVPPRASLNSSSNLGNHRYLGNLMLHYFSPKIKLSLLGASNNVNESVYVSAAGQDAVELSPSRSAITRTLLGGMNLNVSFSKKTSVGLSYNYVNSLIRSEKTSFLESVLPNNRYVRNSQNQNESLPQKHIFYSKFKHEFDSTQKINFYCRVNYQFTLNEKSYEATTSGESDQLENQIIQNYDNNPINWSINPRLNYQKKFKKKGQELVANLVLGFRFNPTFSYNYSLTNLYNNNGMLETVDTLEQEQSRVGKSQKYTGNIIFRLPIGKQNKLQFRALAGVHNGQNNQLVYDIESSHRVENDSLSDAYWRHNNYQELKMTFKRKTDAYHLDVGLAVKRSALEGVVASNASRINQAFYFPIGNLRFRYLFSKSKNITFNYTTRFSTPRIDQLQPVVNNQNPLSIRLGNPDLLPEYQHNIRLGTTIWDQLTATNFYANLNLNIVQNSIIQSRVFDENFRAITVPINSELTYRVSAYLGCNKTFKKLGIKLGIRGGANLNRRPIMLNTEFTKQLNQNYNGSLTLSNKKKKIIDCSIAAQFSVGHSTYENNDALKVTYINHSYRAKIRATIAKKWNLQTSFDYRVYANTGYNAAIAVPLWSASFYRTFLKDDLLKVEILAQNILNEAVQVTRSNQDGIISENQSILLGRYLMLKVSYQIRRKTSRNR